jgi:hypothetical protein
MSRWDDPTTIIAILALIAGIIGSLTSYWMSQRTISIAKDAYEEQRKNDRNAVKPIGRFKTPHGEGGFFIKIVNTGNGPLNEKSIETFKNGDPKNHGWPPDNLPTQEYERRAYKPFISHFDSISGGDEVMIFNFDINTNDPDRMDLMYEIKQKLKELTLVVKYTDVFHQEYTIKIDLGGEFEF